MMCSICGRRFATSRFGDTWVSGIGSFGSPPTGSYQLPIDTHGLSCTVCELLSCLLKRFHPPVRPGCDYQRCSRSFPLRQAAKTGKKQYWQYHLLWSLTMDVSCIAQLKDLVFFSRRTRCGIAAQWKAFCFVTRRLWVQLTPMPLLSSPRHVGCLSLSRASDSFTKELQLACNGIN